MSKKIEIIDHVNMAKSYLDGIDYLYEKFLDDLAEIPETDSMPEYVRTSVNAYKGRIRIVSGLILDSIEKAREELDGAVGDLTEQF